MAQPWKFWKFEEEKKLKKSSPGLLAITYVLMVLFQKYYFIWTQLDAPKQIRFGSPQSYDKKGFWAFTVNCSGISTNLQVSTVIIIIIIIVIIWTFVHSANQKHVQQMRCRLQSISIEEMSLQTFGKRRNRQLECSQLSRQNVPCDWTSDRETSATPGRLSSWDVRNAGGTRLQLSTAQKS